MEGGPMKSKKKNFFHIGGEAIGDTQLLDSTYKYQHLALERNLAQKIDELRDTKVDEVNNSGDIFLLDRSMGGSLAYLELEKLPSHQIFYESLADAKEEEIKILALKGAKQVSISEDPNCFIRDINHNFAVKTWGTSINNSMVDFNSSFRGEINKKGSSMFLLTGEFGSDYEQIILWKNSWRASGKINIHMEVSVGPGVSYFYRVYYSDLKEPEHIVYRDVYPEEQQGNQIQIDIGQPQFAINFALYVKGTGRIQVGDIHIRYGLKAGNFLAVGGQRLVDRNNNEELGYYFNAGDLKPPLNVYFSGYRPSEGYEGRWMMGSLGSPFILVYDPRLVGGAFYRGHVLENKLITVIKEKLKLLGFTNKELTLSGLSMGTYGAFYYGAKLEPHAILVGKPLANIGHLAVHSRVFSPYDWDLAMDTIMHSMGSLTQESAKKLDREFWEKFKRANFSKTTFIIAHMLNDTDLPFSRIFSYLKKHYPTAKILHKGLEGRHNDNTPGITGWFFRQYKQLLISDFNREMANTEEEEVVIEEANLSKEDSDE